MLFAPKILKDIFSHLPTVIFKTVDIKEVITEAAPFVIKFSKGDLGDKKRELLRTNLNLNDLIITNQKTKNESQLDSIYAERILEIYFKQIFNPQGLILDLRPIHFSYKDRQLLWKPNSTWYKFKPKFRESLLSLYIGFYKEDDKLFTKSLKELNLCTNLGISEIEHLKNLFKSHFGENQTNVVFNLEKFNDSFANIFSFFLKHEIHIETDFIFLGMYLITLYQNLELYGQEVNVKEVFFRILEQEL